MAAAAHRRRGALALVAVEPAVMLLSARSCTTPLYPLYRQEFGFSGVTLTLIYAAYVLGNLGALPLFGRLADQYRPPVARHLAGDRRRLCPTIAFAIAAATPWLFAARACAAFPPAWARARPPTVDRRAVHRHAKGAAARIACGDANFFGCVAGPCSAGCWRNSRRRPCGALPGLSGHAVRHRRRRPAGARNA